MLVMANALAARAAGSHAPFVRIRTWVRQNGLSIAFFTLFAVCLSGQIGAGLRVYNADALEHGEPRIGLVAYLGTGHFVEAMFENWESEFLQMGLFVVLTAKLFQRGSAESKELGKQDPVDADPRRHQKDRNAPWPVKRGGAWLWLYERSLAIAFAVLFFASMSLHALGGLKEENAARVRHGEPAQSALDYVGSSQFWFESMQNWQSEFIAVLAVVLLTVWLRQRGSPQSKPVFAPHTKTGKD
jgi:hypothetical protein